MSFPRYFDYKDSGVVWLGNVPTHWEVLQGRRLYLQIRESALPDDEQLSATQKYGVVPQHLFMEMEGQKVTLALSGLDNFKHVESDDFVISLRSFQGGIERSKYSGCVSPAYTVLRSSVPVDAGFMAHVLKSPGYIAALQSVTDGIRDGKNISYEQFGQIGLPYPNQAEQAAIAAFLDRETAKIDALVAEQEKLIALLKEKRQAVISHAVTKGLDPNVPMKDSGIEWLGEVPKQWTVASVRRVIQRIEQGWSPDCFARPAEPDEWGVVKSGCVNRGVFVEQENKALPETLNPVSEYEIHAGDVLMSRASGSPELVGSTAYITGTRPQLMLSDKIFRIHPEPHINREFFAAAFNSHVMRSQIERAISGAEGLANNLPQSAMKGFFFVVPPLSEQKLIVSFLVGETAKFDTLAAEAQRAVQLLKERRSALISAAVTGKIDVRGLAAMGVVRAA